MDMSTGKPTNNLTQEVKTLFHKELNLDIKTTDEAIANESVQKYLN